MVEVSATGFWRRGAARGRAKDAAADRFAAVVLPHLDAAYNLARMLSRDDEAAREIVQDSCERALRYRDSYRGGNARAWLLAIVRSRFLDWARARRMDLSDPWPEGDVADLASDAPSAEALLVEAADSAEVRRVLESLPPVYKEVLIMREMEELSYREIADAIECPMGTVMSRLARARRAFAEAWAAGARRGEAS